MKKILSFALAFAMILSFTISANAADIENIASNSQFSVVEIDGVRTVIDRSNGASASYDTVKHILTLKEAPNSEEIILDLSDYYDHVSANSGSAYSNNNEYGYSSTGNPALWTLQIPNQIKFTYERTQGALISQFVANVDDLIEQENDMMTLYGTGVVALLGIAVSGAIGAAIVAVLGLGVDVALVIKGLNAIKTYKQQAEYYFDRIVTYSTP